ncbi:MAG: tRNA epoxyqueuosine(34) reductase QueG [Chitinophagaceae bacterium]|nr:tRNA epoxyqueuosine(34) reductase QueG [Chitinophagaceae bacterium]
MNGKYTNLIKTKATELGFMSCGIAKATRLNDDAKRLESWLNQGFHGQMSYMENHFDKRVDPRLLVEGAKSVVTLILNYFPEKKQPEHTYKVSKYAYGNDYHEVIKSKLKSLIDFIHQEIGEVCGRGFVDSAPVLERAWALKSGLGWVGKNGNLLTRQAGSFFFIATLIIDLELDYDDPFVQDYCGSCTKCIDACPTEAILPNKVIDGSKCISYFTIELKEALFNTTLNWNDWIFGCDVCQDVCPWNKFAKPTQEPAFAPKEFITFEQSEWEEITEDVFTKVFKNSPVKRTKYNGLKRNIHFLSKKNL